MTPHVGRLIRAGAVVTVRRDGVHEGMAVAFQGAMQTRLTVVLGGLVLSACTIGTTGPGGDDGAGGDGTTIAGAITADTTWSGTMTITGNATIDAGVTVTIAAGTEIEAKEGVSLTVAGTLEATGTEASKISFLPTADATRWAGIVAEAGGSVHLAYAEGTDVSTLLYCHDGAVLCELDHVDFSKSAQAIVAEDVTVITSSRIADVGSGGLTIRGPGGDLTVRDSYVLTSSGDIIVQSGGNLLVEYSEIGNAQGVDDHCNFHISSAASLTITHTNIINGVYGIMIGGTTGASLTGNNWMGNSTDVDEVGVNAAVDLRDNYWQNGAPALGAAYDVSSPSTTQIADAGPRT